MHAKINILLKLSPPSTQKSNHSFSLSDHIAYLNRLFKTKKFSVLESPPFNLELSIA